MTFLEWLEELFSLENIEALDIITQAGPVVKGVIILLILFSVVSWGIIVHKYFVIRSARRQSNKFLAIFWTNPRLSVLYEEARKYEKSPIARVFRVGYQEFNRLISTAKIARTKSKMTGNVENREVGNLGTELFGIESIVRVLKRGILEEVTRLENRLTFLATTGSTCPFIGLFGTVWGIMNAFKGIGASSSASIAVVSAGISEALIATAFGLAAAIPAVMAYNYYLNRIKVLTTEMDNFSSEFLNIVERHIKRVK